MGILRQFGQLLWKNVITRKREPHILLLEIVWPILTFIIVALIRSAIPPEDKPTCSYAPHAMPSAGLVPFLQSSLCNIENTCEQRDELEVRLAKASKLSALVSDVEPYLVRQTTLDALDSMETGVKLAEILTDTTTNAPFNNILGNDTMKVKSFFKDPDKVRKILVQDLQIMSSLVADAFLESTVNVFELLNSMTTGYIDFRGIVCDPSKLETYMFFPKNANLTTVTRELCDIPDSAIPGIVNMIQQQLDVAAIFRVAKSLTSLTNDYQLADGLDDVGSMVELLSGTTGLGAMLSSADLKNMKSLLNNIPVYLNTIDKMGSFDTRSFDDLLTFLEPLVHRYSSDLAMWNETKAMFQQVKDISQLVGSGTNTNWTALLNNGLSSVFGLFGNTTNMAWITQLQSVPDLTNITMALLSGDMTALNQLTTDTSMDSLQQMISSFIGEPTMQTMLGITDTFVDMMKLSLDYLKESSEDIGEIMKDNTAVRHVADTVMSYGPDVTMDVIYRMLQIDNVLTLYNNTNSYVSVCHHVIQELKDINTTTRTMLGTTLCTQEMTAVLEQIVATFDTQLFQKQMETHFMNLQSLLSSSMVPTSMKLGEVYTRVINVTDLLSSWFSSNSVWFDDVVLQTSVDITGKEWSDVSNKVSDMMRDMSWSMIIVTVGPVMEGTDMWQTVGPIVRSVDMSMEIMMKQMGLVDDESSSMAKMNEMLQYVMKYAPEITQSFFDMMTNQEMMTEVFSSTSMEDFCQKNILLNMSMPSYVPIEDMNALLCTSDWDQVANNLLSTLDVPGQIAKMMESLNTTDSSPFDWTGMVKNMDQMMAYYSDPMSVAVNNPIVTLFSMNMSVIDQTMNVIMYNLQQMDIQKINSLTTSGLSGIKQLDNYLSLNNDWRTMRIYIDLWNAFAILSNKQLEYPELYTNASYLETMSATFAEFLDSSASTAPGLLTALKNTTMDVTKFFQVLLNGDWNKICDGTKITDLLTSSNDLANFEDKLCSLNWTQILTEIQNTDDDVKRFMEKVNNLATIDWDNVPIIDLNWDTISNNTQKMIELLMKSDLNIFSGMSLDSIFKGFDLQKSNATWNDFTSIFNLANGLDMQNLIKIFDGLNAVGASLMDMDMNGTMSMMVADTLQSQMYSYHLILKFTIKQLQYFNDTKHIDLRQYFKSSEMNKLFDVISSSPEVTTVALLTLIQTMQNPSKVNTLMTSWDAMCNDLSVFKSVVLIPANTTVDPADLQTKICGLNLNVTKLYEEVSVGLDGFQHLMESIVNTSGRATPSQVAEEYNVLNLLLMDLFTNPPNITISHDNAWLMESKYSKAWEDFIHKLNEGLTPENYINSLTSISTQTIESIIQSFAAIPEFQSLLNYMSLYMTVVINRLNDSLSASDINSLYEGYPEMQKAAVLLDELPHLYQAWVFNSIYHSNKLASLLSMMSWDQFCGMTDPLLDVPGANFSVSDFQSKLCQLNLTRLMIESTEYNGISEIENLFKMDNSSGAVDTAKLVTQFNQFSAQYLDYIEHFTTQDLSNRTLPRFLNMQYWMDTTNYLNMILADPTRLMSITSSLPSLLQSSAGGDLLNFTRMMMDADPFFKQMIQTYKAAYHIIQHVMSKIENKTVITAEDIFGNATETIKLWGLFVKPGVLETVLNSVNTPQMSSLFAKTNMTEVVLLLCHSGNFSHYFTVPSYITLDINQLKTDFCALDLMKIASEFMQELQVYDAIVNEAFSNSSEIEWKVIAGFLGLDQTLTNQITALTINPPLIQLPALWMNESYWLNLLIHYTESRQDPSATASELSVFMESLKPMLNVEPFASMGFIMDIYLQLLLDNLGMVNSTTLSLDNLFRSIPSISNIYTTLKVNDSILNELLLSPIKKPEEFVKLLTATDPYKYFCENEKYWHNIFEIGSDTPAKICSGNSSDILEKLLNDLKYSDYMNALSNMSTLPDWTRIIQNSMKLSELLTGMFTSNSAQFDLSNILTVLSSYNNTDFLWNYLSLFSQFGQVINSSDISAWENLQEVFQAMHFATEISNGIIDYLIKPGSTLDFGKMFKNTSVVTALFNSININSESMEGLFSGYLRTDKIPKLLTILGDSKALESFLCDAQQWHDIFDFPSSLDLSEIISPLCNKTDVMAIFQEQLDIQHIMPLLMNLMQQNQTFNIQTFTSDIEKLTSNIMRLFNLTSADFTGVDLQKLGEINMTEILMAVQREAEKLNANQEMYAKLMQDLLMSSANTTDHTSQLPGYFLAAANVWLSVFNKQLTEFLNKPMNFTSLLSGSVGKISDLLVKDLSWMDELLDAQINPQKLSDMLMHNSSAICTEGFWDSVVTSGDLSAVHRILREICSINESSIIEEAMSGFLNSHLFSQQLAMLTDEYNKGNMEWNITSLSPNIMELINILMSIPTNHQASDFSHLFNVTSFSSIIQRLETMLQQELGSQLAKLSSSIFSIYLPTTDPMMVKAIQTFTVVIEEINSRLMHMQGTVSLSALLKNSTELVDIFESILNIGKNGTNAVISNNIDVSKLTEVFASPDMFTGLCKNNTLADYITPEGVVSPIAADLSKVMCIFPEAMLDVLMDQTRSDKLQKQIDKIWNSNTTGTVDWENVQLHINNFTALLTTLIEKPSTVDPNLMTTLDFTMIWKSMEGLFQNPQMLLALAGTTSPLLNIPVDSSVYPYYLTWQEVYAQMNAVIKSLEGSQASTNGAIQNLWNAMVSMNSQLNLIQQNGSYADLVAELGKDTALQSQVCDMEWIKKAAGSDQAQKVYGALCGQDPKDWNKRLTDLGFPEFYGYFLLTNMIKDNYSDLTMSGLFDKFVTQIQNLTASLGGLSPSDIDRLQHILLGDLNNLTIDKQFYQSFNWLNLIDNSTEGWLLGMLNFVTEVNSYVERQLSLLKGMGEDVPLTLLLPNNTVVAQLLEEAFGKQTAATILAFNLAPDKYLEIAFSNSWKDVICGDVDKFAETFRIPVDSGTNITKLQHDLCEDLSKQDSTINSLLQRLDMKDVFKAFDDWMMGKTSSMPKTNYTNLYMAIQHKIEEFVATVTRIQNLTLTENGMDAWLKPILAAMENLNTPQNDIGDMCDAVVTYVESSPLYRDSIRPVLVGVYQNMQGTVNQMQLQHVVEDLICGVPTNSTDFLQKIVSSNMTALLSKVLNPTMDSSGTFQCSEMVELSNHLSNMINATIFSAMTGSNFEHCGENLFNSFMMFIQDISSSFQLVQEILKMLTDPSLQGLLGNEDLLPVVDFFLNAYNQQQAVSLKFMDIFTKPGDLSSVLQQLSNLAPETINSLLQSTLKADSTKLLNMSSAELENLLCNPAELDKLLTLPDFSNISLSEISKMLCYNETKEIADVIQGLLNINLLNTLQTANATDLTWWTVTLGHLVDIIGQFNAFGSLPSLDFSTLDFNNLQADLLTYMQKFLFDNGPEAIARSLNFLIEDFARLDPEVLTDPIVKDIQTITLGLTSLKAVRNFIPPNVLIRDVIKDRVAFHDYLTKQLNLSSSVADTIIDSTIQYAVLLPIQEKDMHGLVCDATRLSTVLTLPQSSGVSAEHVVASLCSLTEAQAISLTATLLMELDIGDLVTQYVSSGIDTFLQSFNKTQDEITDAVKKLTAAQSDFQNVTKVFQDSIDRLNLNIILQPEFLTGSEGEKTIGDILCGYETSRISGSEASGDITGASSKLPGITNMVERQEKELSDMPATCKNVYDLVKDIENGPILWEYLKPLLWGTILYTPDTPTSRTIAEKVYNSSFKALADVQSIVASWTAGTKSLLELMKKTDMKSRLESVLENPLVDNLMKVSFGVSGSDFLNGFYSIDTINTTQLDAIASIADVMNEYISCVVTDRFEAVSTEQQLEVRAAELNQKAQFLAGLVFENVENGNRKKRDTTVNLPKHVSYKIRMDIDNVMHTMRLKEQFWRPKPEDDFFTELRYLRGFAQLQDITDRSIISLQTGVEVDSPAYLQEFPTPCFKMDTYLFTLSAYLLPVLMTLAWLFSVAIATRHLMKDRENGQEEILKIMGMNSVINFWVWFIFSMLMMGIVSVLCIVTLRVGNMFVYSNFGILLLYFLDFCFSTIMLCYMVSAFFTRTTLALLTVVIVYFLTYLPYVVLTSMEANMLFWHKTLACLASTTAFGFGAQYLSRHEILMDGVQWHNINVSPIDGDEMNFSWTCIMMLIDGVIYLVIGWYIRNVKPGKYGVGQPWYFPVSLYYWGCMSPTTSSADKYKKQDSSLNEPMDKHMIAGISVRNLSKKYGKAQVVDHINADFYENQTTILLGHNGAAKTTTLNMITGVLQPSSGNIKIYGKSLSKARHIGLCPQHDALYDYMTVQEHMEFYGSVKCSWPKDQLKENIYQLLKEIGLLHVSDTKVSELSGGMKRRLSVALAFVGGSECVILDEPSSGVDPSARRAMWNLISKRKTNCTVLLSTHFLDEADIIGDRIAIMHKGRIMCTGSSHFLKAHLGSGYHLKIAKGAHCDQMSVMGTITSLLPRADVVEDIGSEMTVSLSATVANAGSLQKCLHQLDVHGEELGIASYGLYDTTLEEVFMKVCDVSDRNIPLTDEVMHRLRKQTKTDTFSTTENKREPAPDYDEEVIPYSDPRNRIGTCSHGIQQIWALLLKRLHHYRRDWRMLIALVIIPLLFITAALGFYKIKPTISAPETILTPALYGPDTYVFLQDNMNSALTQKMKDHLMTNPGPGTTCMAGMNLNDPYKCVAAETSFHTVATPSETPKCSCVENKYTCNNAAINLQVPWIVTNTTDILQNLDGHDVTDYLLMTRNQYKDKRYGGWSFNADGSKFRSTVWFNNKGHHALPSFYNGLSNTMLRALVPTNAHEYGITAKTHPIMLTEGQLDRDTIIQKAADYGIAMTFLVALTFIPSGLVVFLVNEHVHKEKQLQFLSGVGPFMYWTTSLLWDMLLYCIVIGLSVGIMAIFQQDAYWERDNLPAVVTLMILYGWATITQMYMTIKFYKDSTTSYFIMFCLNIFIGLVTMAAVFMLQFFSKKESVENVYDVIKHFFKAFPPFCLVSGFVEIIFNQIMSDILNRFGDDAYIWPFSFDVIGWHLVALAIEGFVFFIITLLMEIRCTSRERTRQHEEELEYFDEAVTNERTRVTSGFAGDDVLVVNNLTKEYRRGRREFYAVDHMCLGVPKSECFGLLGANGAGKTTTFRMLTGDLLPTRGAATIKGQRITRGDSAIGQEIGYCPQENALDSRLTGRELLHCHARLRGLPGESRKYVVNDLIKRFRLHEADKTVHTYSGGMKRKLSVAMAMIGEPPVVLLDEPTTGMDPNTRRHVWNILLAAVKNQQSVVLSSHSMEECDALCTRLAIMVNGEFKCLGSPQQLKHSYGDGYIVTVYMAGLSTNKVRVRDFFLSTFSGSRIGEENHGVIQVEIPKGKSSVADIFVHLERVREEFNIVHYSVSQTTLDNVFLNFARDQNDGIVPEINESSSEGSHSGGTWGQSASEAFTNPQYSFVNDGFSHDKDSLPVKFTGDGKHGPLRVTKM